MSRTKVKALWPGDKVEDLDVLSNSHGSAPVIWGKICTEHLDLPEYGWLSLVSRDNSQKLWDAWKRTDIPIHHRALLMMTFDRAYITKANYARAAADIRTWLQDFPVDTQYVNHWPRIAEIYESDPDIPAIGLYCTSVGEDPFLGVWNEEKEEYDPIDWSKCYDIYFHLDALTNPQNENVVS